MGGHRLPTWLSSDTLGILAGEAQDGHSHWSSGPKLRVWVTCAQDVPHLPATCCDVSYGVIRVILGFHGNHHLISFAHLPSEVAGVIGQKLPRPCSQLWETSLGEDLKQCFAATWKLEISVWDVPGFGSSETPLTRRHASCRRHPSCSYLMICTYLHQVC